MKTSQAGVDFIKQHEKCRLTAYKPVAAEKYFTIGYGHHGPDVTQGMTITQSRAEELLKRDLAKFEDHVTATGLTLTQNQFDALVSFAYNCGAGNLQKLIEGRDYRQIADAMLLYNKGSGKVLAGLIKRRTEERALFLTEAKGSQKKTIEEVSREVIDGLWGNGAERRRRLTEAGYTYALVQREVNRLLKT